MESNVAEEQLRPPPVLHMRAARSRSVLIAGMVAAILLGIGVLGLLIAFSPEHSTLIRILIGLAAVAAVGASGFLAYLLIGYFSMRYSIVGRELWIQWAHQRHRVPIERITYAGPAAPILGLARNRRLRFWPGYYVDQLDTALGTVHVVATQSLSRQLLVSTDTAHFAISPMHSAEFLEQLTLAQRAVQQTWSPQAAKRQITGSLPRVSLEEAQPRTMRSSVALLRRARPISHLPSPVQVVRDDPLLRTFLILAVLLNVGLILLLLIEYNRLPQTLVLHWNANGLPDRIGDRQEIWILPIITTLVTVANLVLAWVLFQIDRMAARFLVGLTSLVHLVTWVALFSVIRG
ncbi:MAG: DUF1648 domain-containing protein [Thermorudis peleae]|nr:DUF1648 domain-containing protein [Thermorudis peleae]